MQSSEKLLEILNKLKAKYANPKEPEAFVREFNEIIKKFHSNQENINSFNNWIEQISEKLKIELQTVNSIFFPSLSFFIYHDISEYQDFKIYKMEYFNVSFVEEYYTTEFITYIREEKEGEVVIYEPKNRPKRDSKFNDIYNEIMKEIHLKYPQKQYMNIKLTDYVLGELPLTYSTNPKTTIYEVLFRTKDH